MNTSKSSQAIVLADANDDEVERWGPAFVYFVPFLRYGYDNDIDFDIDPHSRSHDPMHLDIHDQTRISGPVVVVPCIASNSRVQTACEQVHPQLYIVIKSCFRQMRLTNTSQCTKPVCCVYYTIKSVVRRCLNTVNSHRSRCYPVLRGKIIRTSSSRAGLLG